MILNLTRTPAVPVRDLLGSLPFVEITEDVDHATIAATSIKDLSSLKADALTVDALWRDLFVLTGTLRTFFGSKRVEAAWAELSSLHRPFDFSLIPNTSNVVKFGPKIGWIQAMFTFETAYKPATRSSGIVGIVPENDGKWKIWLICTTIEQIKGFPNPDVLEPRLANGVTTKTNGQSALRKENGENVKDTSDSEPRSAYFDCVVIGAGSAGLSAAGRLQALEVSYVTLERSSQVGVNWLSRYHSAKLHTPKEYGQLPFGRIFPAEDPYYLSAQDIARGYQKFADQYSLNIWLSTNVQSAFWNEDQRTWALRVQRDGEAMVITTRHMVLALGPGGRIPRMPEYPNRKTFQGVLMHSVDYKTAKDWKGKAGVVIGTGNTAHDVAQDMVEAGLSSVTMVQRNKTVIVPDAAMHLINDPIYNDHIPIEIADRLSQCPPNAITRQLGIGVVQQSMAAESEFFESLERTGFKLDRGGDVFGCLLERFGGHYVDVGALAKIIDGSIKMKSDAAPVAYTSSGLEFHDGSKLDADVVVFCTGFEGNMRIAATEIVGEQIGDQLEDWGKVDSEGEILGAYKPIGHPGIWYTGGTLSQGRFFSRFVALQIKADLEGIPFQPYTKTPA